MQNKQFLTRRFYAKIFARHSDRTILLFRDNFISHFSLCTLAFSLSLIKDLSGFLSLESIDEVLLQRFLGKAMTLAVGVELIKMFSKPSPNTVIEVLLFALARQLVLDHANILDFLIGILAVAILFAVRKYLFTQFDATNNIIMRASQKVKIANVIARVNIQANKSETLRDFITRKLSEEDKTVAVGACV